MLATFEHLDMSRWSGVSLTCPQQVVRVMLVEFGETTRQTDKKGKEDKEHWAELFSERTSSLWQAKRGSR